MVSRTTRRFRDALSALPADVQRRAEAAYELFRNNPQHPGLRFKKVHATLPVYSVRIDIDYRAVGTLDGDEIVWFWIGTHGEYDQLLKQL